MKRIYSTFIKQYCDERFALVLPDFVRAPASRLLDRSAPVPRAYMLAVPDGPWLYIYVQFFPRDRFGFSVAWSTSAEALRVDEIDRVPRPSFKVMPGSGRFSRRLSFLYSNADELYESHPTLSYVKLLPDGTMDAEDMNRHLRGEFTREEYEGCIKLGVDRGMYRTVHYAVPYFGLVAHHYGSQLNIRVCLDDRLMALPPTVRRWPEVPY